ncbi:response regulator [Chryseobacterium limigenitum]|uniref:cAMP-binding domain of CRP or a regulatory subunit of cAMP-dependent protein kinases n=1 Tax=Chryseobacterium limigenitum TaxID=1612149 RepID=A0A1K2IJ38_9FLAO|nr:response regulator [Chryseobacterium limigenitum]SFZ92415.1 cAMP-binding domain of CRP or a regulatory subunit of cAMP-dependent protein kinases [Chryseobacterium limigenitum]
MEKISILIIEDNADIRESTSEILELADYEVFQASNGKQGVDLAIKHTPDVILCDIMMPELDGYGVLYLLSKREDTALIPFIFITAKADRIEVRKGIEMGADDYLTKPFDDIELLSAIESRLKKKERQKRLYSSNLTQMSNLFQASNGLDELKKAFDERKIKSFKKKQIIYYEGDTANAVYLIISGAVKTTKMTEEGKELMTGVHSPEDYFGITSVFTGKEYKETAEVLEDATVCSVPGEVIDQLLYKYPDIAGKFIKILAHHVIDHEEHLLQLAYFSVRKRMAEVLLRLHTKHPHTESFEISRENLASMAGMAIETVSRILSDFKDEKLIDRGAGKITILDAPRLQKLKN